ncbi:amidohydrolase family protein [Psychroflexus sp. YR1-1]|uniref:Amidohydrolase family protein n=1 Tax=Psychroflexus aurantiacus TaxID=2709310 RepID=A0A6B3R9A4_9FLAO|nr:amidohydrolase family protein [Psychroflexus aurantiacus]NEV94144.1 amidohydrolase family protein [Psychroflexus aurantiacus]
MKQNIFLLFCLLSAGLFAQDYFPENKGVKTRTSNYTAVKSAIIHVSPSQTIENATLLFRDGEIVEVGKNVSLPENTVVVDAKGKHVYPSFVEVYSDFGIKEIATAPRASQPQYDPNRKGYYWNDHMRPEQSAKSHFKFDEKKAESMRKAGFGAVNTHIADGFMRGNGALFALAESENFNQNLLKDKSGFYYEFSKSKQSRQAYPSSIMGYTALLRQFYHDAKAYENGLIEEKDLAIEAYLAKKNMPQLFSVDNYLDAFRADKIGDQFGVQYTIIGSGDEYKRIEDLKEINAHFILPLKFPEAYDVEDPFLREYLTLGDMKHWQYAPSNAKILAENGVDISFTSKGLKSPDELLKNLKKAVERGLDKQTALAGLTTQPAKAIGASELLGTLEKGKIANFIITSEELFEEDFKIYENWVQGQRHRLQPMDVIDISGTYDLVLNDKTYELTIKNKSGKFSAEVKQDTLKLGSKLTYEDEWMTLVLSDADKSKEEYALLTSKIQPFQANFDGKAILGDGNTTRFRAIQKQTESTSKQEEEDNKEEEKAMEMLSMTYPNSSYGRASAQSQPERILIKNATVITGEAEGTLENTDVLLKDGKIAKIGKDLSDGRAEVIDGTGKFLTAGIIDEHSHIAGTSINEGGHNSSAEVTMEDAVDPDDISIYRSLAGGVTSIQLLHGSANPIGGRSAVLKLKWGENAEDLIYDNTPKHIKFALGENVKQSNWGGNSRFPQTRMGVEQVFRDYFTQAKAYGEKKASGEAYRHDDEMETLLEILNGERYISCHSYVQSEINMLMKVAEEFDFTVNTFTHILEGYKVADIMAEHGAGGSTFSDWWAYKYEVNDAIPFNAAIMHNQGVTVAINSDDGEMIRRLNQEAAKSMKYGGVPAEDAWKFVTLNPAKLLHIDDRVGSIKEGKDADVVLWNGDPLSIYATPEKTIIEGVVYFDIEKDLAMRERVQEERQFLINKMMKVKNKGLKTQPIKKQEKVFLHCDSLDDINHIHE